MRHARPLRHVLARYLFALLTVGCTFAVRLWLLPLTGTGAPFVLFFAAVLATSLLAGVRPGALAVLLSMPLAAYMFVVRAGYTVAQAAFQSALFAVDGAVVVYLTYLIARGRSALQRDLAERQRLADERQVFVSFVENSSDFIGIADPSGKPIYVNPAGRRMVGLPADRRVEETQIPEYYPEEERRFAADVIVKEMVACGKWSGETYFRNWQTGAAIPVSDEHFLIRDPASGRVLGMGTITRDISEARRTARALRESEERFRLTLDEAPIGMALVALDGRFLRVNRALCEIVGYAPEELTGLTFQAITHPDDLDADVTLHDRLARGEIPRYQLEKRYLRKDGSVVHILLSRAVVRSREGAPLYFVAQIEDISERKRIEQEQRLLVEAARVLGSSLDYEETLKAVAGLVVRDYADVCLLDLAEGGEPRRLQVASAAPAKAAVCAALERFPLDRSRPHLGLPVLETRRPLLVEHMGPAQLESFAQGEEHLRVLRGLDAKSMMATPLLLRGELLGVLVFISSDPARAYRERDLRVAEALSDRAAVAIENARLYRASVEAARLRDQVLGLVAHDLRNPLGVILMQAAALDRRGGGAAPGAQAIHRAAARMNRLIQDLLDVAVMEAGKLSLERAPLAPAELIADAVEAQRPLAASAARELRVEAAGALPEIAADRHRLLQVFENLIGNAVKFTRAGGRITVGAAARAGEVVFSVADDGAGIAPDELPHVFERFWQARRTGRGGAGLGLAISQGIVEAHGGRIWVESALGRGSTFYFAIPAAPPATAHPLNALH